MLQALIMKTGAARRFQSTVKVNTNAPSFPGG